MPETGNMPPLPDWKKTDPPDWIKDDVVKMLRAAIADRLYTRLGSPGGPSGWFYDHAEQARQATYDESEVIALLEEHGCLIAGQTRVLKDESGEPFNADHLEITPAGRELFARLNPTR
ncbi:hypothetical protein ADK67_44965 [Saccharothrix sp. NRRL B-16348]|uniref:hypothetical protein n=1 Tax=Saccharothrix sp. NRRL B-16348 TaxID=1415542 RepID=UPI0006AECC9D|nr:hypothetical protein [Saccharothrix sp. NRRL B-16348]KOX12787.1 hypothetical protein ADK67_44965 [Saccharothrix sp. NRRL B-16348]